MSLGIKIANSINGMFNKLTEPVVLKETSSSEKQLEELKKLLENCSDDNIKKRINEDIKLTEIGIAGENAVLFELKNSHIPMYILHDLYIEHDGLTAQIDFLVVTRKYNFIIECKNLYGNIIVDETGAFSRKIYQGNLYKHIGIYSPVTQNQRHLDLIKAKKSCEKSGKSKSDFLKWFDTFNKSVIVLAAPQSTIDLKKAPKSIKDIIVRADGLIAYLKRVCDNNDDFESSDKEMQEIAEGFLKLSKEHIVDYSSKYSSDNDCSNIEEENIKPENCDEIDSSLGEIESRPVYKELKEYRLMKSRKEGVKAYFVFNNEQLKNIVLKMPKNKSELLKISGFGEIKVEKYGDDIISIIQKFKI